MKKSMLALSVFVSIFSINTLKAQSIDPVSLIIAKVIKAIDLKVQRLQNETLVSQVFQQQAEQALSSSRLSEITGWQTQLGKLYEGYFAELKQVRPVITGGALVKNVLNLQQQVVLEYGRLGKDVSVKPQYDALLQTSMDVLQTLQMTLSSQLSMKDAERICVLQSLRDAMYHCLESIRSLNKRQTELITNHARLQADLEYVKRLHGIQ